MTTPALEEMRALAGLSTSDYRLQMDEVRAVLRAAAEELDRLRAVIENAPHATIEGEGHQCDAWAGLPCTCWKADAL